MDYSHRTILRHLAVAMALLSLPFFLGSSGEAWVWYRTHSLFLGTIIILAIAIGFLADYLARKLILAKILLHWLHQSPAKNQDLDSDYIQNAARRISYTSRLILLWASCSRCLAYWIAGVLGLSLYFFFWPYVDALWANLLVAIFFFTLAASIAAGSAVLIFFLKSQVRRV